MPAPRPPRPRQPFADYGQYLDSLEMTATIRPFEAVYMQRIAQLTNKSNQFNLTTLRCTEDDIHSMQKSRTGSPCTASWWINLRITALLPLWQGRPRANALPAPVADELRVLKRGMEDA